MKDLKKQIEIIAAFFSDIWNNIQIFNSFFKIGIGKSEGW